MDSTTIVTILDFVKKYMTNIHTLYGKYRGSISKHKHT